MMVSLDPLDLYFIGKKYLMLLITAGTVTACRKEIGTKKRCKKEEKIHLAVVAFVDADKGGNVMFFRNQHGWTR